MRSRCDFLRRPIPPCIWALIGLCTLGNVLGRSQEVDNSGRVDDYSQWKQALGGNGATGAALVSALPGFEVELIRSAGADEGSWVSMAFDPQGRIILAREDKGLLRLTLSNEPGGSQRLEAINDTLLECRGLLFVGDRLFANANNSKGLYRLTDTSGDDQFDEVKLLREMPGNVGHGRNDLALGPDGCIYLICGNDVKLPADFNPAESPLRDYAVDRLLPCRWNDTLFNFGVLPPAGHVIRTDEDGQRWEIVAGGFRNPFGIDFNDHGEMFTFDADMEWDAGLPWYRPCRVNHIVSGADYGWRQGIGKWPAWYPDSLPATIDIGLASPTAVQFGHASNFPKPYRRALFILDWAYGRILAIHLTPHMSTYQARAETFLRGRPLNVTDLAFGPDGAMYFTTGGRKTQSGLYRVQFVGQRSDIEQILDAADQSEEPHNELNATLWRKMRRDLEVFHGRVDEQAVDAAWPHLGSADAFTRHAARVALEAQPPKGWADRALAENDAKTALTALMALARVGSKDVKSDLLLRLKHFANQTPDEEQCVWLLRDYSLVFLRLGSPTSDERRDALEVVGRLLPHESPLVNQLGAELLVYLAEPQAPQRILSLLRKAATQGEKIHYLYCLSQTKLGWTDATRREFLVYLREADGFHGARYVPQVIGHIREDAIAKLSDEQRATFATLLEPPAPVQTKAVDEAESRPFVRRWELDDLVGSLENVGEPRDVANGKRVFAVAQCAGCHRVGAEGGQVGPDLTSVARRFGRRDLVDSMINPSKVVDDKYRNLVVVTARGAVHSGMLLGGDDASLVLSPDPLDPSRNVRVPRNEVESQQFSLVSPMPQGTLDRLTKDEILDLVAYLEAAASQAAP
ncbi:MAG: c-type cytochrome [Planctomycetales bacterium]|nr:c-type cytochrome [Planctomycetales bacterium]